MTILNTSIQPTTGVMTSSDQPKQIFVFGSNEQGVHGKGAALVAVKHWGAVRGVGVGLQGCAYAIPTKSTPYKTLPLSAIATYVEQFIDFARRHSEMRFLLTKIGCGLAGYTENEIAPLFVQAPANVVLINERGEILGPAANRWD